MAKSSQETYDHEACVIILGMGVAGSCAAIEAHDNGARVIIIEKQAEENHYSNTRMSGGAFHSPNRSAGDRDALIEYAKAMMSGENIKHKIEGENPEFSQEQAEIWAELSPDNEAFMKRLDPEFKTISMVDHVSMSKAAFPNLPGADKAGYEVLRSTYTAESKKEVVYSLTRHADKNQKQSGEAFNACLQHGLKARNIEIHYNTRANRLITDDNEEIVGVICEGADGKIKRYGASKAVVIATGGYEYNKRMRKAFLEGLGAEGWAFYGSPANTGDGIEMAMRVGAGLAKVSKAAGRIVCAVPLRKEGLRIGVATSGVGHPNEIVVDSYGERFAAEDRITKDPSRYIFYKDALQFNTQTLDYPRIPSWMVFDEEMRQREEVIWTAAASYNGVEWGSDNMKAIEKGWILSASTLEELSEKMRDYPDNRERLSTDKLLESVNRYNESCDRGEDEQFNRDKKTLGPIRKPPFYAIPLYPGGPNTKGGLRVNAKRQVLDWSDREIGRLFAVGEICSVFQFVYQGGGNLAEGITFGRFVGRYVANLEPR